MPWAPLLCMTKTELIQVAWRFSAYSHLCAQSTVSVYWLSWRPRTMCRGGCWNKEEPNSSSNTRKGMAAFSKGKAGVRFSPFCATFLPLSQLCHCRAKNSLGQRERLWIFPWRLWHLAEDSRLFMPLPFFILSSDSFNAYRINWSPNRLKYIFYYIKSQFYKAAGWQNWNDFSCHVMSDSLFQMLLPCIFGETAAF